MKPKSFRNIRVIPVVVVAIFCLAVLKVAGLVLDGGYVFDYDPQSAKPSWAQDMLNFPGGPPKVARRASMLALSPRLARGRVDHDHPAGCRGRRTAPLLIS